MRKESFKAILHFVGRMLMAEGALMLLCLVPALHFGDGTALPVTAAGGFTLTVGAFVALTFRDCRTIDDRRMSYLLVTMLWVTMSLFGTLPLIATGATLRFSDAFFESMSGVTSTGATIFGSVEVLPSSVLLWRSMSQWFGGFGIILIVVALSPSLGINRYSLYTAEASGADNTGKTATSTTVTVRRMLVVYVVLTLVFIAALMLSGLHFWDAVNVTFANISSGGFSIYDNSLAALTNVQQYIVALAMLLSGVNFTLLYLFFTFRWGRIGHKLDQFAFYITLCVCAVAFVTWALHSRMQLPFSDALRMATVQSVSVLSTTGSLVADTAQWWLPVTYLFVVLALCGGMAGSTSGGLKVMRVLILLRNVKAVLRSRLHPAAVDPVRLNGKPVLPHIVTNVMVVFFVYVFTIIFTVLALMLCGINATESIGATVGCITGYGPGLGLSGGFGCYEAFTPAAKWVCSFAMLLGRLECLTVLVLLAPRFWRR
ncbi:MAG: TrkH family potassium uptake protein [Bacteroidales bacterium]|nr:TrkH family potassium uptake protein [Bacteroidales bacterium]